MAGISIKLNQVFGNAYQIYTDEIKQGLEKPCFFIKCLKVGEDQVTGNRYFRSNAFDIHFFPQTEENSELFEVTEKLLSALEYITLINSDMLRGTKMHEETVDGILHFFVNYNLYVNKERPKDEWMENLSSIERVK